MIWFKSTFSQQHTNININRLISTNRNINIVIVFVMWRAITVFVMSSSIGEGMDGSFFPNGSSGSRRAAVLTFMLVAKPSTVEARHCCCHPEATPLSSSHCWLKELLGGERAKIGHHCHPAAIPPSQLLGERVEWSEGDGWERVRMKTTGETEGWEWVESRFYLIVWEGFTPPPPPLGGKAVTAVTAKNHLKFVFKNHDMFGRNMKKNEKHLYVYRNWG